MLDTHQLRNAQSSTNSSTRCIFVTVNTTLMHTIHIVFAINYRVLNSLEQFVSAVHIMKTNESNITTRYTYWGYQSYGISLVEIDALTASTYQRPTLSASRRKNSSTSITEWTMKINDNVAENDNLSDSLAVTLQLPKEFLNECASASDSEIIRVAYLVFSESVLFWSSSSNEEQVIGSVIASAQVNCSHDQLSSPITITYNTSAEVQFNKLTSHI